MRALTFGILIGVAISLLFRWQSDGLSSADLSPRLLEIPKEGPRAFQEHSVWDSGKAEFCVYRSTYVKYGIKRSFETDVILIREFFNPQLVVKVDDSKSAGAIPVFKMNRIRTIPTGIYDYRQSLSAFVHRAQPAKLLKLAFSSSDGCGMSYSELKKSASGMIGEFHTYWEKGLSGKINFEEEGVLVHDQLPLYLRSLELSKYKGENLRLAGSVFTSYLRKLPIMDVKVENLGIEPVALGSRVFEAHHIRLQFGELLEDLWFAAQPTQPLLVWKHHDGAMDTLKSLRYLYYWQHVSPGDRERFL
jgi:hypothetical protein